MPTLIPDTYGAPPPPVPSTSYGVPDQPRSAYGPPTSYGPPAISTPAPIIHKHVYVHVPPPGNFLRFNFF